MALSADDLEQALKPAVDIAGKSEAELEQLRGDDGAPAPGSEDSSPESVAATVAKEIKRRERADAGKADVPDAGDAVEPEETDDTPAEPRIPQSRVNEIVARAKARTEVLQNRVAELEQAVQRGEEALNFDEVEREIDKLEGQYSTLILEGKATEAAQLRRNIRGIERRVMQTQAAYHAETRSTKAIEELRTDEVIDQLEEGYTFLDPSHPDYDKETVDEILAYQRGFVATGHRGDVAMAMAAKYVLSQFELEPEGGAAAPDEGGDGGSAAAGAANGLRRGADFRAKAELAGRLPPAMRAGRPGVPHSTTAKDLASLGQQGFDKIRPKLSEDDLARARGDIV